MHLDIDDKEESGTICTICENSNNGNMSMKFHVKRYRAYHLKLIW